MLLIVCPYCGKRPEIEFSYGGQAHVARPVQPSQLDDQAWAEFLYMRINTKGVYAERWRHSHGCGRFFNALRDTTTDHFLAFYKTGELQPKIAPAASPVAAASPAAAALSTSAPAASPA
ncbi:MAG: sarcosine oxidase subunit delta, partial [Steroidobacteraceae bacterium]